MLTTVVLRVDQRMLQTILAGLDELPGKVGREAYCNLTLQVQDQVRANEQEEQQKMEAVMRESLRNELTPPPDSVG